MPQSNSKEASQAAMHRQGAESSSGLEVL